MQQNLKGFAANTPYLAIFYFFWYFQLPQLGGFPRTQTHRSPKSNSNLTQPT